MKKFISTHAVLAALVIYAAVAIPTISSINAHDHKANTTLTPTPYFAEYAASKTVVSDNAFDPGTLSPTNAYTDDIIILKSSDPIY